MSNINLLPWRENDKKQKQKNFYIFLVINCFITLTLCFIWQRYMSEIIEVQNQRNKYLQVETAMVDKDIAEIDIIKAEKIRLVHRIELIQKLDQQRSLITHLLNIVPVVTPSGVYLDSIHFDRGRVDIKGKAKSTGQVSKMVRNIENTEWLEDALLPSIVSSTAQSMTLYDFYLNFNVLPGKDKQI